jgi:PST family polysaccharide transporter
MQLIKTSAVSAISTLIKILLGMLSIKFVALYTGPTGVAMLGQFTNFVSIFATIAGGGIGFGVIKYVSEYADSNSELQSFLSSTFIFTLFFSGLTCIIGLVFHASLANWILGSAQYSYLISWLAVAQFLIALNLLLNSILNGFKQIKTLAIVNIASGCLSLILIAAFATTQNIQKILLGFMLAQCVGIFAALAAVYYKPWFRNLFRFKLDKKHCVNLLNYSFMTLISTLVVPVSQILVRNDLAQLFSWNDVGYWQAVTRISDAYLLFVTVALSSYYLPRLSELKNSSALKKEIKQAYLFLMPCVFVMLAASYLLRDVILQVLYSPHFKPAENLFFFQLLGDLLRIAGWMFTYLLLAKSRTKTYISTEIALAVCFVLSSHIMARAFGLIGVTYAFALTYFCYWIVMYLTSFFYFKSNENLCSPAINP